MFAYFFNQNSTLNKTNEEYLLLYIKDMEIKISELRYKLIVADDRIKKIKLKRKKKKKVKLNTSQNNSRKAQSQN